MLNLGAAVVVMARAPEGPRPPKTRLAKIVPEETQRRLLYAAFLTDVIATCGSLPDVTVRVAYTVAGGTAGFEAAGVSSKQLLPQRGQTLGDRERNLFEDLFQEGFSPVVIIGSDLPTLPCERVVDATERLRGTTSQVVLGPSDDGGYYLIGLRRPPGNAHVPDLFTNVRWSTQWTRADTIAAADLCGLAVEELDNWYDVDDEIGFTRLRAELATAAGARRAPATARVMRKEILGGGF